MLGRLLVGICKLEKRRLAERSAEQAYAGRQHPVREPHRNRNSRHPRGWRKLLIVVARGTFQVAHLPGRVAPGGIDDGIEFCTVHGCDNRVAERDLSLVVVGIYAWSWPCVWIVLRIEIPFDAFLDTRQ